MKPSRAFWGTLFVVFGLLMLVGRAYDFDIGFEYLWKLWPIAFVLIGLAVVFKNQYVKNTLAVVAALGLALIFYGVASLQWLPWHSRMNIDVDDADAAVHVQEFSEPFATTMKKASLSFDAAAGKFVIDTSSAQLFKAKIESPFGKYNLTKDASNDEVDLRLKLEGDVHVRDWKFGKRANQGEIVLNPLPVWDLSLDVGAAHVDFDLSPLKIDHLDIDAGAASVRLRLGMPNAETQVKLNAGASSMRIAVPESVGCEIRITDGLSSKRFEDFDKVGKGRFQTPNFNQATKKIFIDAEAGVSSIRVVRY